MIARKTLVKHGQGVIGSRITAFRNLDKLAYAMLTSEG
jgi:hypothetical protein